MIYRWMTFVLGIGVIACLLAGCGGEDSGGDDRIEVGLEQEFLLAVGERVAITGEALEIMFLKVTEDSRCPRDVTCVWEGRACCLVELTIGGISERKELKAPGMVNGYSFDKYGDYNIAFHLGPYPESNQPIPEDEYRLLMLISKRPLQISMNDVAGSIKE